MGEPRGDRRDEDAAVELLRLAGPRPSVAPERQDRVRSAVRAHWLRRTGRQRLRRWVWWGSLGAAAASALVVGVLTGRGPGDVPAVKLRVENIAGENAVVGEVRERLEVGTLVAVGSWLETGEATRVALELPDRTSLRLDARTRLFLESHERFWLERGAVYLDSGDGGGTAPVTVAGALGEVVEIGTRFQVRVGDERLEVWVRGGRVAVRSGGQVREIAAGRKGTLDPTGTLVIDDSPTHGTDWEWTMTAASSFRLEGRTAAELMRWVARETGLELDWASPDLAEAAETIVLHGGRTGVRPDRAAEVVLPTCGLEAERVGNTLRVRRITR